MKASSFVGSTVRVELMQDRNASEWDEFVYDHPQGTFFHLHGWRRVIQQSLNHQCPYMIARAGSRITGVLPLVEVRSLLFGHALISTGFCVGGGVLASDPDSASMLLDTAEQLARERNVRWLELRAPPPKRPGWAEATGLYYSFRKALDANPEVNFMNLRRKQRAVIRKSIQCGLNVEIDSNIDRFHSIYASSMRDLGTPVLGVSFFKNLLTVFAGKCEVSLVTKRDDVFAGLLSFYFKDDVLPYYAGSNKKGKVLGANDVMYDSLMRRAVSTKGIKNFDFGRSKNGTGAFNFKRHWGFEPNPLSYGFWLPKGGPAPMISPANPKFSPFVSLWQKQPLWCSNFLGPSIARSLA